MITSVKLFTALATMLLLSSFANKNNDTFIGTYGVSSTVPSQVKLTINADHTFYYQDFSVPQNKIIINGNWTVKGHKILLIDNDSEKKFHNVWSFTQNGQIAKSRKGIEFYRLCKING